MHKACVATTICPSEVDFDLDGLPQTIEITVVNQSDRFATFQVELLAPGAAKNHRWYTLSPAVAHKQPPGDETCFRATLLDSPIPGFVGLINLTVAVFSVELGSLGEDRNLVRLRVNASNAAPLEVILLSQRYALDPLGSLSLPVQVNNRGTHGTEVMLQVTGLPETWLASEPQQRFALSSGLSKETQFVLKLPPTAYAGEYPFQVQAVGTEGLAASAHGQVEVMATGGVDVSCEPTTPSPQFFQLRNRAAYALQLHNTSNAQQAVTFTVGGEGRSQSVVQLWPDQPLVNPHETVEVALDIYPRRRWLGRSRTLPFQLETTLQDANFGVNNGHHAINVKVIPWLPIWAQGCLALLILCLLWWFSWLNPDNPRFGHQAAVNRVQFDGAGDRLVSASDDQTVIHWQVAGFFQPLVNQELGKLGQAQKSVRVVRHRPVDNNWVAAGLENGEIRLWSLEDVQHPITVLNQKDDRVLDLSFSLDSQFLFSGHGSGLVIQWPLSYRDLAVGTPPEPAFKHPFGFAVYGLTPINETTLAVAGRFNQVRLWNWQTNQTQALSFPRAGSQDDYITSIARAAYRPTLFATADNQGYITLWNLEPCLDGQNACELIDEWAVESSEAVRSVALSDNGCYLAGAGADGQAWLWPLTKNGRRAMKFREGIRLRNRSRRPLNSVDIRVTERWVLVASGGDDTQVRVKREPRLPHLSCDSRDR